MKKHSTGALTKKQKEAQDKRYKEGHSYDYVIIGTGMAALTVGSLLANAGKKVCLLEAHDIPGGYAHSFEMNKYHFCAQIHYIWGCGKGGKVYEFLKRIGLEKDITFEPFDPECYDRMVMPDGKHVSIPYGFDKLAANIEAAYPGEGKKVEKFCAILMKIREEIRYLPQREIKWWEYPLKFHKFLTLYKYRKSTLQDLFDECKLSKESQAVLCAQAGDFMLPPNRLSLIAFEGLFCGYNTGAYYPTKHFKYFTERLASFIEEHDGCHVYYESRVVDIKTENGKVVGYVTEDGKEFTGENYICNMDPQAASHMIGRDHFSDAYKKKLDYEYSPSGVVVYLGLKDIDLTKHGFGKFNTWHLEQWDMNKMWKEQLEDHNFEKPWIFISTPSLHTKEGGTTPKGGQIMEIATVTGFDVFKELQEKGYSDYNKAKMAVADRMLDIVEEKYVPNLRKHIAVKVVGSPTTNVDFCLAPKGNAYGSNMTPEQMNLQRLKAFTPFSNFYWCNASSGYAGVYGTVTTGVQLYMDLTDDRFYDGVTSPTDDEFIKNIAFK